MEAELTGQDFEVLLEALVAWESKDAVGDMMEDILMAPVLGGPAAVAAHPDIRRRKEVRRREAVIRKERSVLLQAKLIQLRDRQSAGRVLDEAATPPPRVMSADMGRVHEILGAPRHETVMADVVEQLEDYGRLVEDERWTLT